MKTSRLFSLNELVDCYIMYMSVTKIFPKMHLRSYRSKLNFLVVLHINGICRCQRRKKMKTVGPAHQSVKVVHAGAWKLILERNGKCTDW
eukprot:XP_022282937.1 serine-rich single-pass membrane protein 1 isoform X5 [Canis lupus familiaris]